MPLGNEQEGRSQVISTDVADTIESILPQIMRTFTASPKAVQCIANNAGDEPIAKQATDYLNHVFYKDNDGFIYGFHIDSFIQLINQNDNNINPYNRNILSKETISISKRTV